MSVAQFLFWFLFTLIVAHYVLFPLLLLALCRVCGKPVKPARIHPSVTLIVTAYNEAKGIAQKIENALVTRYPREKLEIIVVSDGSSDATPELAQGFANRGVRSLHQPARRGKTHAMNRAVAESHGEILVFSDANCLYRHEAIQRLVDNFADETVGAVSGQKKILDDPARESTKGDTLYWNLESRLKGAESRLGSVSTGDGEIFAVRRSLYPVIAPEIINDDMAITLGIVARGYRVLFEPAAISEEAASLTLGDDFKVKARMVAGGYQTLALPDLRRCPPLFLVQWAFHKGLRYTMPLWLGGIFLANLGLSGPFYSAFLALQLAFYAAATAGYLSSRTSVWGRALYLPLYYCAMNLAALLGLYYFLRGRAGVSIWKRAVR